MVSSDRPARLAACLTVSSRAAVTRKYYNIYYYNIRRAELVVIRPRSSGSCLLT